MSSNTARAVVMVVAACLQYMHPPRPQHTAEGVGEVESCGDAGMLSSEWKAGPASTSPFFVEEQ